MITHQISCTIRPIPGVVETVGGLREVASVLMMITHLIFWKVIADVALAVERRVSSSVSPPIIRLIFVEILTPVANIVGVIRAAVLVSSVLTPVFFWGPIPGIIALLVISASFSVLTVVLSVFYRLLIPAAKEFRIE